MKPLVRGSIARRLFLFNILVVFMPVAGFFSLSMFEDRLLAALEDSMVQQGRIIAAWLGTVGVSENSATELILSLKQKHTARIRIIGRDGSLLADSAALSAAEPAGIAAADFAADTSGEYRKTAVVNADRILSKPAETTLVYKLLSFPVRILRNYLAGPQTPLASADFYSMKTVYDGPEIQAALAGRYGAISRISSGGQNSVTLYSALPVAGVSGIEGSVLVSQSSWRILKNLYDFRLETGKIFLWSLVAATLVSIFLALTISRPLSRLKKEAEIAVAGKGLYSHGRFHVTGRDDEIDKLSASLSSLVESLRFQIHLSENFASDAAHEMRNRIAGIRTSAEILSGGSPAEVAEGAKMILESAGRMEQILADLRQLSKIEADEDAAIADAGHTSIADVAESLVAQIRIHYPSLLFSFECCALSRVCEASLPTVRFQICLENLLENAASFSPPGGTVFVTSECFRNGNGLVECQVSVRDRGPGIPAEHLSRVFDRFFTWRENSAEGHTGIGLAIVEAIMRKAGGTVVACNHEDGGAKFTLHIPVTCSREAALN